MKTKRSIVALILAFALCMSLVVSVSATSSMLPAGIYGKLRSYVSNDPVDNWVASSTSITQNPDNARFIIAAEFSDGSNYTSSFSKSSSRGVTSFSPDLPIYTGTSPNQVYTAHTVQDGTGSSAYADYLHTIFN